MAIICGRGSRARRRCRHCGADAPYLCDWKLEALGRSHTCSRPICVAHAVEVGVDRHLCPEHQGAYVAWLQDQGIAY
jgi:hypothetical protein